MPIPEMFVWNTQGHPQTEPCRQDTIEYRRHRHHHHHQTETFLTSQSIVWNFLFYHSLISNHRIFFPPPRHTSLPNSNKKKLKLHFPIWYPPHHSPIPIAHYRNTTTNAVSVCFFCNFLANWHADSAHINNFNIFEQWMKLK